MVGPARIPAGAMPAATPQRARRRRAAGRRLALGALLASTLLAAAGTAAALVRPARADEWRPDRPVTMIVAFAAGGGTDTAARTLARFMERDLGQPQGGDLVQRAVGLAAAAGRTDVIVDEGLGHVRFPY